MAGNRILFATDVPFWQTSTGAEQRIYSMHRFLAGKDCTCAVFYLGQLNASDHERIQKYGLDVVENSSDQPPEKLVNRFRWYADATLNQARKWLSQTSPQARPEEGPQSLKLSDYCWPWAQTRFAEVVDQFQPSAIIFEYISMTYLLDVLSDKQRSGTLCLVDTHDVLHRRAEQFFANGFPHWLDISAREEAETLKKFDSVIAIQNAEAETFRSMVGDGVKVITAGHAVDRDSTAGENEPSSTTPKKVTVGYIGSKNFSNWQAIREFLNCAWPSVMMRNADSCELAIAGDICDWFDTDEQGQVVLGQCAPGDAVEGAATQTAIDNRVQLKNVRLLGRVDRVEDFYDAIDLVINPVQFGTGLKIKNAESLRYGKLLITTLNGFTGMPETTRLACKVVESVNEMGLAINSICSDLTQIRPMQSLAEQLAQTEFSESQAYSELWNNLDSN